jgi:hypothetical protein
LRLLDYERQNIVYPGVVRSTDAGLAKDMSADGKSYEIVYSSLSEEGLDRSIRNEIDKASCSAYELEWKLYGHDRPGCLAAHLVSNGFEPGDREAFLVCTVSEQNTARFTSVEGDVKQVICKRGLSDYRQVYEEVTGTSFADNFLHYSTFLEKYPNNMSLYVAYVDGEPAACGRAYFHLESQFTGLFGGQTRMPFRNRGLYTQLVGARLREAFRRGVTYAFVDALPTSEPILRKRGFEFVTFTQAYRFRP